MDYKAAMISPSAKRGENRTRAGCRSIFIRLSLQARGKMAQSSHLVNIRVKGAMENQTKEPNPVFSESETIFGGQGFSRSFTMGVLSPVLITATIH